MGYTMDVISRSRKRLEEQNAMLRSRYNARQAQVYEKLPQVLEIDKQLRRTMVAAAKAALSGQDAPQAMEAVRRENQALQAQREALISASFGPGYLDEPICKECSGSGYVGARMCRCLEDICRQEQDKEAARLGDASQRLESFRLDYYSDAWDNAIGNIPRKIMEKNLYTCKEYARNFAHGAGNLLFNGGTGLGKTFLAVAVGKEVAAQGYTVCYEGALALFDKLEKARFNPTEENLRRARELEECDLLILDDLGTEFAGQFVIAALYGLLNSRLQAQKAMIITTNLNIGDIRQRYSPQIASRLDGEFILLPFVGADIRKLKKQGFSYENRSDF